MRLRLEAPAARFAAASACGGLIALVILAWFAARPGLLEPVPFGNFYEIQARSWLDGRWDADPDAYSFERFNVDGRYMTYFGPWPAVLRVPLVAVSDSLDGRLSGLAVLLACAVLLAGVAGVSWEARRAVRDDAPPTRRELLFAAGLVLLAGCGTTTIFLAGWTAVYHEAILWGAAWSVVSYWFLIRYLRGAAVTDVGVAGAAAAFALLSRGSVGLGPVVGLGIVAAGRAFGALRGRDPWRAIAAPAAAALIPLALFAWVNAAKFGHPFGAPPVALQDRLLDFPTRRAALAANDGSLFGVGYVPTTVFHYLRPDGIRFDRLFPWVAFAPPARVIGGAVFESLNPSSSVPATSTLPFLLAVGGVVTVVRSNGARRFAAPLIGATAGASGALALAFVDQRYQGDFIPLLVVAALLGAWALAQWLSRLRPPHRIAVAAALVVLAAWSCWANGALSYLYARAYQPYASTDTRADLVRAQLRVHALLSDGPPSRVRHLRVVPLRSSSAPGTLAIVGQCDGLLWSDGRQWQPVEQTPATGLHRLRLELAHGPEGRREPILSITGDDRTIVLWATTHGNGTARLDLGWFDASGAEGVVTGTGDVPLAQEVDVEVRLHPGGALVPSATVQVDGEVVLEGAAPPAAGDVTLGRQPFPDAGELTLSGHVEGRPRPPTPLCDRLEEWER